MFDSAISGEQNLIVRPENLHLKTETFDPAEFEQALQPWDLLCQPTEAGQFSHQLQLFVAPEFMFYQEQYGWQSISGA